jgi:hypothetical protein
MRTRESLDAIVGQMQDLKLGQDKVLTMQTSAEERGASNWSILSAFLA